MTTREQAEQIVRQIGCEHAKRTGGNDYILCDGCGLMWDYRRETPQQALAERFRLFEASLGSQLAAAEGEKDKLRKDALELRLRGDLFHDQAKSALERAEAAEAELTITRKESASRAVTIEALEQDVMLANGRATNSGEERDRPKALVEKWRKSAEALARASRNPRNGEVENAKMNEGSLTLALCADELSTLLSPKEPV